MEKCQSILALFILLGVFAFIKSQFYVFMFNTGGWKMAAPNVFVSMLELALITVGICSAIQIVKKGKIK